MNSAMSGRPIAASSAATTVSNGWTTVMVSRSISISRTVMDWRFRRRRYRSDANESVYDDCHVIMQRKSYRSIGFFALKRYLQTEVRTVQNCSFWKKQSQSSCEHHGGSPRLWLDGR